ncbi:hypothetical protein ACWC9T_25350 [Kitasatospora sp. NPDC001159]
MPGRHGPALVPDRPGGWQRKAALNGFGALLTGVATLVVTGTKPTEGAWGIVVALPLLVVLFVAIHTARSGSANAWSSAGCRAR